MRGKPSRLRGDLDIHCLGIAPGAVHWTTLRKAGLAFCAVMGLTGSACFWWLGESAEWYRGEIICHSRIPVVAGNPPPWLGYSQVAWAKVIPLNWMFLIGRSSEPVPDTSV